MDTGKLLKVIEDVQEEERGANVQSLLTNVVSYYDANDPTSLNTTKEQIKDAVTTSRISQYALSDYQTLQRLEVAELFGPGLYQRLNNSLGAQAHEVKTLLQQLVTERDEALSSLNTLQKSLLKFDFESRTLDDGDFEIGFTLPESYADLEKTEGVLKDLRLFLDALASAVGVQQPLRITYVSNGSIELFLKTGQELAQNFSIVIDHALQIYGAIEMFLGIKKQYKKFSKSRKEKAEKIADEEKKEQVEKLVDELIKKLGITNEDDKNRVKGLFKAFLKHIEAGVGAEVHTPKLEAPAATAADATNEEKAQYKKSLELYEKKKEIDTRNREIFILQQNNFYGMDTKFLDAPEDDAETTNSTDS